jgi:hypothetical protein
MNRRGQDFSQLAASIDDLKIKLYSWFSSSEVRVCRRNANKVAHMLAFVRKSCNNVVFLLKKLYCQNSTKDSIPWFVHPNMILNWVLPFDSNRKFHAHPNTRIGKYRSFPFHLGFGIFGPMQFRAKILTSKISTLSDL